MMETVFGNPFLKPAYGAPTNGVQIMHDHWLTVDHGISLYEPKDSIIRWVYFQIQGAWFKATPEFLDDKPAVIAEFGSEMVQTPNS